MFRRDVILLKVVAATMKCSANLRPKAEGHDSNHEVNVFTAAAVLQCTVSSASASTKSHFVQPKGKSTFCAATLWAHEMA